MYFEKAKNITELTTEYRNLAKVHHPDVCGSTETMQAINVIYSKKQKDFLGKMSFRKANIPNQAEPMPNFHKNKKQDAVEVFDEYVSIFFPKLKFVPCKANGKFLDKEMTAQAADKYIKLLIADNVGVTIFKTHFEYKTK